MVQNRVNLKLPQRKRITYVGEYFDQITQNFTLTNVRKEDSGVYVCKVKGYYSENQTEVLIDVYGKFAYLSRFSITEMP